MTDSVQSRHRGPVRVVVVDDEPGVRDLLTLVLSEQGWHVVSAADGREAIEVVSREQPDLVVLDVVLPDIDGLEVMSRLADVCPEARVLFLTANDAIEDRVAGITAGGDDYVTKPFSVEEVVARLRGLLRRRGVVLADSEGRLRIGDLSLYQDSHQVFRGGTEIRLTAREFELLALFMTHADVVLSKERILDEIWGYDFGDTSNVVELYVSYVRRKLDRTGPPMISTIRRVGYVLRAARSAVDE